MSKILLLILIIVVLQTNHVWDSVPCEHKAENVWFFLNFGSADCHQT